MNNIYKRFKRLKNKEYIVLSIVFILAFVVRLYKVNGPIADWHSWRQADTASVSRSYVNSGIDLLRPRYHDISTIQSGIFNPEGYRLVEFPIYNVLHSVAYSYFPIFNLEVWGRLITIFSSMISGYFVFLIGKRYLGTWGGVLSAGYYLLMPFNIYFSRVILPEPLATTLALASLWVFTRYIDKNNNLNLFISSLLLALALLVKPFVFFYAIPMLFLVYQKYGIKKVISNKKYYLAVLIVIAPLLAWRAWISQYPEGIPFWKWAFNGDGIRFKPSYWYWIFSERLGRLLMGVWGIVPLVYGILSFKKSKAFIHWFLIGTVSYLVIVASANVKHDYYQIVIIPPIALGLAYGTLEMVKQQVFNKKIAISLLIFSVSVMFISGWIQVREFYKVNRPEIIEAGAALDEIAPKDALVIAPYNGDAAFLYQTGRWGWPYRDRSLDELIEKGADYYISVDIDENTTEAMQRYEVVRQTDKYIIIDLNKPRK